MSIEAMKQALEALERYAPQHGHPDDMSDAITALRIAIAEAEKQEPVAWRNAAIRLGEELSSVGPDGYYNMTAEQWLDWAMDQQPQVKNSLTTPPAAQRQPLTEGRVWELAANCLDSVAGRLQFARAIEAAHGIGENK